MRSVQKVEVFDKSNELANLRNRDKKKPKKTQDKNKSETVIIASFLKEDPNIQMVKRTLIAQYKNMCTFSG